MGMKRPTASGCALPFAVGRFHHAWRPSADEPRYVAVGHRAALRPPEVLPFRRLAAPVEVEAAIPQKGHEIGFDGFAGHRSLTTRLRSAALRLTAEIRHDFGRPPGSNVTRRSSGHHAPSVRQDVARVAVGQVGRRAHVVGVDSPERLLDLPAPADSRSSSEASVPVSQFHGVPACPTPSTVRRPRRATARWSPAPSTYACQPFDVVFLSV